MLEGEVVTAIARAFIKFYSSKVIRRESKAPAPAEPRLFPPIDPAGSSHVIPIFVWDLAYRATPSRDATRLEKKNYRRLRLGWSQGRGEKRPMCGFAIELALFSSLLSADHRAADGVAKINCSEGARSQEPTSFLSPPLQMYHQK